MSNICPVCGSPASVEAQGPLMTETAITCPTCGVFVITEVAEDEMNRDEVAAWLYYHAKYDKKQNRYTSAYYISKDNQGKDDKRYVTLNEISNWYPRSFNERISMILLGFAQQSEFLGNIIELTSKQFESALFIRRFNGENEYQRADILNSQTVDLYEYLENNQFISIGSHTECISIKLLTKGWQRVDDLQKYNTNNKEVFVSMAFNDGTTETRKAIKAGIIDAGYSPEFIDEIIHNHQIMPEMFRMIRECRFLIMDVTDPNYGAYYEAGYALGLGKEVIITCREQEFHDTNNKPHFDIAQKQILVWKDYPDLTKKLIEWIKAIAR